MLLRAAAATTHRVCGAALKFVDAVAVELVAGSLSDVAFARCKYKYSKPVLGCSPCQPDLRCTIFTMPF